VAVGRIKLAKERERCLSRCASQTVDEEKELNESLKPTLTYSYSEIILFNSGATVCLTIAIIGRASKSEQ
jgi:hypothetical protein